ncbi:MAG TPA: DUF3047 domain-containing protein [Candidatus Limnocylindria bacterium]|nr:DUF3047 domain-containing protein [Candidatus Limnocylindria bacterium]
MGGWNAVIAATLLLPWHPEARGGREWHEHRYHGRTSYVALGDTANAPLHAETLGNNSALLTRLRIDPHGVVLRWRWRVLVHPDEADPEVRSRDDRAAGVLLVVRTSLFPWRTRALLYQWTPAQRSGLWSRSPYSRNVRTLVLEHAPADSLWREETRDLEADLARAFGQTPDAIAGLGVICDADNTGRRAVAEFGPLQLVTGTEALRILRGR